MKPSCRPLPRASAAATWPPRLRSAALVLLAAMTPMAAAQPPQPAPVEKPAWPKLETGQRERLEQLFKNLASKNEELRDAAEAELQGIGAAAAPLMIAHLSDLAINVNESLLRVLPRVTAAEHAPLLAQLIGSRRLAIRQFVAQRLAELHPPEMGPVFRAALRDRDASVVFLAKVGLAGIGDLEFMDAVFERCSTDWNGWREVMARALRGAHGEKATHWLLERMTEGTARDRVTGLRLLRTVGVRSAAGRIAGYLDSESHNVKKEAINALRAIVDGEPPLDELSVFEAIEMAKKWKEKI